MRRLEATLAPCHRFRHYQQLQHALTHLVPGAAEIVGLEALPDLP